MDITLRRRPISVPILPIVTGILVLVMLFVSMRVGRIQGSEIAVFVHNVSGTISVETTPGAHVYNGVWTDFYVLDNTEQTLRMAADAGSTEEVNIKTQDGSDVSLDVELNYRLVQDPEIIRTRVVPECSLNDIVTLVQAGGRANAMRVEVDAYKVKWIRDYARSVIRYVFGELRTDEFYVASERESRARESEAELNRLLNQHGIQVTRVVPHKFRFYEEYETKITEKKAADQEVQSQMAKADAAVQTQRRREAEATASANVAVESMKGALRKEMLVAEAEAARERLEAEAYAITTKTAADAKFYATQNEAKSALAIAEAEAVGLAQIVASLSGDGGRQIVRMEYAKALKDAVFRGVPYATDPRIQKVEVTPASGTNVSEAAGAVGVEGVR